LWLFEPEDIFFVNFYEILYCQIKFDAFRMSFQKKSAAFDCIPPNLMGNTVESSRNKKEARTALWLFAPF